MYDSFVEATDEWQAFVGRRVEADLHLWQDRAREGARSTMVGLRKILAEGL